MKSIRSDLPRLKLVLLCTLLFSLAAHAYIYFSFAPGHDSMMFMIATDDEVTLQISNGRFLQPVYWLIRSRLPAPWLVGMMSMVFLTAGGYFMAAALGLERRLSVALLCGVLSVNLTVTDTNATFIYTADTYLLAMAFACAGVWLWERLPRGGALAAVPCFTCCMGLYQAYIDVAIGLALLLLMRRALEGERFSGLWKRALRYAVSLLAGAALYYVLVMLVQRLAGVAMSTDYNSLNLLLDSDPVSLLRLVPMAYYDFFRKLFSLRLSYNPPVIVLCRILAMLTGLLLWVRRIRAQHVRGLELLVLLACAALLPLGLNFVYVLAAGVTHELMIYSFYLIYALPLLPLELEPSGNGLSRGFCEIV